MGTRNLTMVISNGKTKVAQYGQWDGYPEGQGETVLSFLHNANLEQFKKAIKKCKFVTQKELKRRYEELGITGQWMNMEQSARFKAKYPQHNRDMAAEVLQEIYDGNIYELDSSENFAADSLFCEWAYVIDLDKNTLEVYQGFNTNPLTEEDRFFYLQAKIKDREDKYYPVKLAKSYDLSNLPTKEKFFADFKEVEEEV